MILYMKNPAIRTECKQCATEVPKPASNIKCDSKVYLLLTAQRGPPCDEPYRLNSENESPTSPTTKYEKEIQMQTAYPTRFEVNYVGVLKVNDVLDTVKDCQ